VDLHGNGVSVRPIQLLTGEEDFSEVVFEDVFVPEEMVLGKVGEGWRQVMSELSYERSGPERFLSTYALLAELVREVGSNPTDGESRTLGGLYARLAALRELSMEVARSLETGKLPTIHAAMVKDMGTRFERDVVETARVLVEPAKGSDEFRRLYAEAVTHVPGFTLRGGTSEILRGIIARELHA
jgi:alkylation response protein AidB-like acyl-CoA dehydrogenase